uniref:Uncharacterized protein n=1 Tax=Romanomermis culicivorax TaxID=13658 RepID=A0A915KRG6_ROMCU
MQFYTSVNWYSRPAGTFGPAVQSATRSTTYSMTQSTKKNC